MKYAILPLGLAVALSGSVCGLAQDTPSAGPQKSGGQSVPPRVSAAPYYLAGDDAIQISVINFPNLSTQVAIPPDGNISVPLLQPMSVTGKTTNEVAQMLTEKWRKFVVNPVVTVTLTQRRKENVLIYGYVPRAGTLDYRPQMHILELIAEVGGASAVGDLSRTTLTHRNGERQLLDLSHPETKGGTEQDVILQVGDVVYVPEKRTQVSVLGEVNHPGSLDYREDMTILDALGASSGVKETADLAGSTLIHAGKETKLDLEALLRRGDLSINTKMAPGDRILVPEIRNRTYVFGAVGRPGYYNFKPGDRVLDALTGSGGPLHEAGMNKINVIRIDRAKNTADVHVVDIDKFLKKGDQKGNVPLEAGDVIFVPDRKKTFQIGDLLGILSGLNFVDSTLRIFTGR